MGLGVSVLKASWDEGHSGTASGLGLAESGGRHHLGMSLGRLARYAVCDAAHPL